MAREKAPSRSLVRTPLFILSEEWLGWFTGNETIPGHPELVTTTGRAGMFFGELIARRGLVCLRSQAVPVQDQFLGGALLEGWRQWLEPYEYGQLEARFAQPPVGPWLQTTTPGSVFSSRLLLPLVVRRAVEGLRTGERNKLVKLADARDAAASR